jgi:hypothetical protein
MPTIELTDEQAEQLKESVGFEIEYYDREIANAEQTGDEDIIMFRHIRSVMSDILHLLEIA